MMKLNPKIPPWAALLAVPAALLAFGCCSIDKAMFPAPASSYSTLPGLVWLDAGGRRIAAVYLKSAQPESKGTILYSHGNAEDIGHLYDVFRLYAARGYDVFAYDYPGYGLSEGSPTQKGCMDGALAAYNYMIGALGVAPERIIAYGRSIGSGPSTWLASERKVGALVFESGFTSTFAVVLGIDRVPLDKFQNIERLKGMSCPVLVIHGRLDDIIAFKHGEALYAAAKEPKSCLWLDNAGHNDLMDAAGQSYWTALDGFAASSIAKSK